MSESFAVSSTSVSASGSTNGICSVSGPYKSASNVIVFFKKGQKFTTDANGKSTTWTMVK